MASIITNAKKIQVKSKANNTKRGGHSAAAPPAPSTTKETKVPIGWEREPMVRGIAGTGKSPFLSKVKTRDLFDSGMYCTHTHLYPHIRHRILIYYLYVYSGCQAHMGQVG